MPDTMRAQVFHEPEKMTLESRPVPKIADDEVLVRVDACGFCGSDVAYYWGASPLETPSGRGPLVLGHELTGTVAKVGSVPADRGLFQEGDKVVVNPVQHCNSCDLCARGWVNLCRHKPVLGVSVDGGLAEYCASHYTGLVKVPAGVSTHQAALTEPLACAVYSVDNLDVQLGQTCVVFGPGPVGLMQLQLIKSRGAGKVFLVGTRDYRLEMGLKLGADAVFNVREPGSPYYAPDLKAAIADRTDGRMADRALCSTGALQSLEQSLAITGPRSTVVFFGLPGSGDHLPVPMLESMFKDTTLRFSWLAPGTWPTALQALATGAVTVEPLITHHLPLEAVVSGLHDLRDRKNGVFKALVSVDA